MDMGKGIQHPRTLNWRGVCDTVINRHAIPVLECIPLLPELSQLLFPVSQWGIEMTLHNALMSCLVRNSHVTSVHQLTLWKLVSRVSDDSPSRGFDWVWCGCIMWHPVHSPLLHPPSSWGATGYHPLSLQFHIWNVWPSTQGNTPQV